MSEAWMTYVVGQRFTVASRGDCCPSCGSAELELSVAAPSSEEAALFVCARCGDLCLRRYESVTPVDPGTGHAAGYPRPVGCTCDARVGLAKAVPCRACAVPGQEFLGR